LILGLHHVTATVADARQDLDFCRVTLGLRLVKRTVNFDNHNVYHFYYGDERGSPGTIWTTFPAGYWGRRGDGCGSGWAATSPAGRSTWCTAPGRDRRGTGSGPCTTLPPMKREG
jgi:catechol 2,3-dioxygenase-like lactoylglutathione lyase family enzyme